MNRHSTPSRFLKVFGGVVCGTLITQGAATAQTSAAQTSAAQPSAAQTSAAQPSATQTSATQGATQVVPRLTLPVKVPVTSQVVSTPAKLFPAVAAPGEQVWIFGLSGKLQRGVLWVGGLPVEYMRDQFINALTFTVPKDMGGGPQPVTLSEGARQALPLTVLPADAAQGVTLYLNPARLPTFEADLRDRLKELTAQCQRLKDCPPTVLNTVRQLLNIQPATFVPLSKSSTRPNTAPAPVPAPRPARVTSFADVLRPLDINALGRARRPGFCQWAGTEISSGGASTGQTITLLDLLFGGELGIDPITYGHPEQSAAPFQNAAPARVLRDVLGSRGGQGKGVTVHVLDTASASNDPYRLNVNYYDTRYDRPYHGLAVGQVVQAVAPGAQLDNRQVCEKDGTCSTLKTVQALCAVADEARRGGKHVVNLSAGGPYPALGLQLALREVASLGVPTAASYGNTDDCPGIGRSSTCNHYPADWTRSFEFGPAVHLASRSLRSTMLFSVAGWDIATRDMANYNRGVGNPGVLTEAPSVQAPGEFWLGGYPYFGTSFAAPVVSGILANWMSCQPGVPLLPLITTPGQAPLAPNVVNACP